MKKTFNAFLIVWIIGFLLFNTITFILKFKMIELSWISYITVFFVFIIQLVSAYFALVPDDEQKLFYGAPIVIVSYIGLVVLETLSILALFISKEKQWTILTIYLVLLGILLIVEILSIIGSRAESQIDKQDKINTYTIRKLAMEADGLRNVASSKDMKEEIKSVYEMLRYSDPVSDSSIWSMNEMIQKEYMGFVSAVEDDDLELAKSAKNSLKVLVDKRNAMCKHLK